MVSFTRKHAGDRIRPDDINEIQVAVEGMPDPGQVAEIEAATIGLPTIVTNNYTRHLSRYASLAAAIADLPDSGANGGEIRVEGEPVFTSSLVIPPKVWLVGRGVGATALHLAAGNNVPLIDANGAVDALIADLKLFKDAGTTSGSSWAGVLIRGASEGLLLERVHADGFSYGIRAVTQGGTMPIKRLTLRDVRGDNSAIGHGIEVSNTEYALIDNCGGSGNEDDGLKIGERTLGVTIRGGVYTENGEEGIDAFAGGDTLRIDGPVCDNNTGWGIVVKTDSIGEEDPDRFGRVRNIQVSHPICRNNGSHGIGLYTMGSGTTPEADVSDMAHATVVGGQYEGNAHSGIYVEARNVAITAPIVRLNGQHGILVDEGSLHTTISNPVVIANSQSSAGTYHGVFLRGDHASLRGGTIIGVDADDVIDESDYSALTVYHGYAVLVDSTASDIYVDPDFVAYYTQSGTGLRTNMTSGTCVFHIRSDRNPPAISGVYGSVGSTFTKINGTNGYDVRFVKRSGAPNAPNTGWFRETDPPVVTALPTASATSPLALILSKSGSADDEVYFRVQTGASTYAYRKVTVT